MQQITREDLLKIAAARLADGTVTAVLGWRRGEFDWDVTPALFKTAEELAEGFLWNDFCGANLSKYLLKQQEGRVLVFLKPCDSYSFNQLLTEHRFPRERVWAVGVPCAGMVDTHTLQTRHEGLLSVDCQGDTLRIHTLYADSVTVPTADYLAERCVNCKSKHHVAFDELLGEEGEPCATARFDEVERLERMTAEERFAFWQNELSRCIRCNACRNVCPACTCETCVFDNAASGVEQKAAANSFEEQMFHIIRAFHVAGRCTDCGECSRVCPQHIPLHLLNRKFIKDINAFWGDYQAGKEVGAASPLTAYRAEDGEPADLLEGRDSRA